MQREALAQLLFDRGDLGGAEVGHRQPAHGDAVFEGGRALAESVSKSRDDEHLVDARAGLCPGRDQYVGDVRRIEASAVECDLGHREFIR